MHALQKAMFKPNKLVAALALGVVLQTGGSSLCAADSYQATTTPIKHVVVIFQENVSFDHYFATYPQAANKPGEPRFVARRGTPSVNGLTEDLLHDNPNSANPYRLDRSEALTCDMDHRYADEQKAADAGLMDKFVESTGATYNSCDPTQVMGYYDGNTVTALWNYAQHFAMSDNSYGTTYGPSTVGALNLIAGQTHGAAPADVANNTANGTVIGDPNPAYDDCSGGTTVAMTGKNVGDLLNAEGVTWGWFEGGFRPSSRKADGTAVCGSKSANIGGQMVSMYSPHHEPFQYYPQTSNPHHLPPSSTAMIGRTDQANHQYDLKDFWAAARAGHMPAVSFLKAPMAQDGHAGYSDPLDEQTFIVKTINRLEKMPEWKSTAVIISYDDSDGWYDHVLAPVVNQSNDSAYDNLTGSGTCGSAKDGAYMDRCGYGPRLPLLIVSPWTKVNYVDHGVTDQSSILRFIEDNWHLGRIGDQSFDSKAGSLESMFDFGRRPHAHRLFLDPASGEPLHAGERRDLDMDRS